MKIFLFNRDTGELVINEYEILLIKEFAELWDVKRNKTKEDPTGIKRTRAYREFTYIWLMIDWSSHYSDFSDQERHVECLTDAHLTDKEWNDETFRKCCRKYKEIQESSRIIKLIKSARGLVDKIIDRNNTINLQERDDFRKPIFKVKEVMAEMKEISPVIDELKELEKAYKKELEKDSDIRGGSAAGFLDT